MAMVIITEHNASVIIDMLSAQLGYQNQLIDELKQKRNNDPVPIKKTNRAEIIGLVIIALFDEEGTLHGRANRICQELGMYTTDTLIDFLLHNASKKYPVPCKSIPAFESSLKHIKQLETETGVKICE